MRFFIAFVLVLAATKVVSSNANVEECTLYLGESTIKNAGWGVFAGRPFKVGDQVGTPSIGIQVSDPDIIVDDGPIHEYLWRSWIVGGTNEATNVRTFLPGVGSLANYHPIKHNVVEGGFHHDPLFDRKSHPGAGANTAYHNFTFVATKDINVGDEVFIGSAELGNHSVYSNLPTWNDYDRANKIIDDLKKFRESHPELSQMQWINVLYRIKNEMMNESDKSRKLLPDTLEQLLEIERKGLHSFDLIEREFNQIRSGGMCLDSIREGRSTILDAGRGAFVTKAITKGTLISAVPLLPIMNSTVLRTSIHGDTNSSQQLLINYCFGHEQSDTVLCPLSNALLINHNSKGANAELRWGKASSNRVDDKNALLELTQQLTVISNDWASASSKLMLEVVATKDLQLGDEIFIDYGKSWERSYAEHIENWTPVEDDFVSSRLRNEEQWKIVADPLVTYECCLEPMFNEKRADMIHEDYQFYKFHDTSSWPDHMITPFGTNTNVAWYPCKVIALDDHGLYEVQVYSKSLDVVRLIRSYHSMPREAIRFADSPYQSDQHLRNSFRNFIPMPDNVFPSHWRKDYLAADDLKLGITDKGVDTGKLENSHYLDDHERVLRNAKCGIYFAPSNIPAAGFSSYTAVPYLARKIPLGTEMSAIVIPYGPEQNTQNWDIRSYVWNTRSYKAEYEVNAAENADVMSVSLANFHPGLVNMEVTEGMFKPVLDSCHDPGAGAFSDYVGCAFLSSQILQPGEELFVSYGEAWFTSRQHFNNVPLSRNYEEANKMVASIRSLMQASGFGDNASAANDLLDLVRNSIISEHRTHVAMEKIETYSQIEEVIIRNGTAQFNVELRSQEWFERHGQCMDHVYYKESSIPQAGKGAFSRRFLRRDSTIISTPLILTWGRDAMTLSGTRIPEGINTRLLLENYQFSHPTAAVYFLPINQVTAINHGSPRQNFSSPPNAKIQWAQWHRKTAYYLQRPLYDLKAEQYSAMVFDVVATRDIAVDEEVLIDYGEEWEIAWNSHVNSFVSPCKGDGKRVHSSLAVYSMNQDKFNNQFHKWSKDHFTVCREKGKSENSSAIWIYLEEKQRTVSVKGNDFSVDTSFQDIRWDDEGFTLIQEHTERIPCKIISGSPDAHNFVVAYFRLATDSLKGLETARRLELYSGLSEEDIEFIHKPFTSDMYLPKSFRHVIKIPDEIFPSHWSNVSSF